MALPKRDFRGQRYSISMMELRSKPGEVIDDVAAGMTIDIEKNGKHVATMASAASNEITVVRPDGSIVGPIPVTFRRDLGGYY